MPKINTQLIQEAIRFGWETFKDNIGFFLMLDVVVLIVYTLPGMLKAMIGDVLYQNSILFYLINIIAWFVEIALYLGLAKVSLLFVDKHKATVHNLYKNLPYVPYLIATVLFSMALLAGLLLFVIPAVVLIVVFGFYIYVLVDKKVGVMESFKQSAAITQGNRINLFLFSLVIG